jgi:hypothetical protein
VVIPPGEGPVEEKEGGQEKEGGYFYAAGLLPASDEHVEHSNTSPGK